MKKLCLMMAALLCMGAALAQDTDWKAEWDQLVHLQPRTVEYIVNGIGLALLILLIVFVSFNDIFKLFTGGFDSMT